MDITAFEMFLAIMILTKNYNGLYNKFGHIKKKTKERRKKEKKKKTGLFQVGCEPATYTLLVTTTQTT